MIGRGWIGRGARGGDNEGGGGGVERAIVVLIVLIELIVVIKEVVVIVTVVTLLRHVCSHVSVTVGASVRSTPVLPVTVCTTLFKATGCRPLNLPRQSTYTLTEGLLLTNNRGWSECSLL